MQRSPATGFTVWRSGYAPMRLLGPGRLVRDEGVWGAMRLVKNVLGSTEARRRVLAIRRVFEQYRDHISAVFLVGHTSPGRKFMPEWQRAGEQG